MSSGLYRYCYNMIYLLLIMIEIIFKHFYIYHNESINYKSRYIYVSKRNFFDINNVRDKMII